MGIGYREERYLSDPETMKGSLTMLLKGRVDTLLRSSYVQGRDQK